MAQEFSQGTAGLVLSATAVASGFGGTILGSKVGVSEHQGT